MVLTPENKFLDLLELADVSSIALAGASGTVWSDNFVLPKNNAFGFLFKITSSGVVNVDVFLEQSNTQLTDAEQGSTHADYTVPDGEVAMGTLDATGQDIMIHAPAVTQFARLKFVKDTGNDATTVLTKAHFNKTQNG